jgi:hypothetical protein
MAVIARERIDHAYREAEVTLTRVLGEPSDEEAHARLADEILGDLADDYEGAVDALREVRGMLTDGDGDAIMGCRQAVARIDRALRHSGGQ